MTRILIVGIVALALIAGGVFVVNNDSAEAPTSEQAAQTQNAENTQESSQEEDQNTPKATITYTDAGFEPDNIKVAAGTTLTIQNDSSSALQFSSDPHPVHTDNPELNAVNIEPGANTTVEASAKGTWGVHNHLNHSHSATLVVE